MGIHQWSDFGGRKAGGKGKLVLSTSGSDKPTSYMGNAQLEAPCWIKLRILVGSDRRLNVRGCVRAYSGPGRRGDRPSVRN